MKHLSVLLLFSALAVLTFGACGSDDGETSSESAEESEPDEDISLVDEEVRVLTIDNQFKPETTVVAAGTDVVWANLGQSPHDIVPSEEGDFFVAPEDFQPGDEYSYRFTEPGSYPYYCALHGTAEVGMIGTIEVTAP